MLDVGTENIDVWSSAQIHKFSSGRGRRRNSGLTAHGINKLRELILELAVRGKLVEQDSNDEPATELLKRITTKKAQLIKAGHIKNKTSKRFGVSTELDFQIPESWISVKLVEISNIVMGQSPPGQTYNTDGNGVPLINGPVEFSEGPFGKTIINQYTTAPTNFCNEGDFLICIRGSTTGRSNIAATKACIGRGVAAIQQLFNDGFVRFFLWRMRQRIIGMGRGVAFPSITRKQLENLPIPLPPLTEQHRIVSRVNELMSICDQLEQQQTNYNATHHTLVETLLGILTASADNKELRENWLQTEKYFDTLFTTEESIDQLKQAILQLAVMGKLVPQNSNDQPASVLLENIEREKARLIQGEVKKKKVLPAVSNDEKQFTIPKNWVWVRFGQIAQHNSGKMLHKGKSFGQNRSYITTSNLYWGYFQLDELRQMPIKSKELDKCTAKKGDLLICEGGEAGRAAVWNHDYNICFQNHVHRARFFCKIDPYYIYRYFQLLSTTGKINNYRKGVGIPNLSGKSLASIVLPLPPVAEQHRIVAVVDDLMALCDSLVICIQNAQSTQVHLANAVVERTISQ